MATHILEELQSISNTVAEIPKTNVFQVPQGYFDALTGQIVQQVQTENFLPGLQNKPIQTVPDEYFELLPEQILAKIKATEKVPSALEEMSELSPTLSAIGNKNVYQIPKDYFKLSENNILAATVRSAKIINIRKGFKNIWKYAAAATVAGLISYFSLIMFSDNTDTPPMAENAISQKTLQAAKVIIEDNSFEQVLASISDQDIANYLEKRGLDVEAALVASTLESDSLPDPEDYLFDENTLNKFLKEQNL